jgi:hypothetical protein
MVQTDPSNSLFTLAANLVNYTARNIFLTGKAGTGKTTFLKYIRENCPKQMAVVAPTGVAAINAGGVTIHSFFQLPFSPFIPERQPFSKNSDEVMNSHTLLSRLRFNNEKRKILQELELLIIDEISMVRCDVLDAIDLILRHVRNRRKEAFGGVQLLFIGDMYQLSPVVKNEEWQLLSPYYNSAYFFDSRVLKEAPPVYIEFDKIYRQTEQGFISLLNKVRNNQLDEEGLMLLESRYKAALEEKDKDNCIILTTHNEKARNINMSALEKINAPVFTFEAEVEGVFLESSFPGERKLELKVGAQVMFIKNDGADKGKRYFNGKIGIVTELDQNKIIISCKDDPSPIEVNKEKWENISYTINKSSSKLEEQLLGSFTQYPLRLAWAITIHKSQGLTFEKAIIDAGAAFAPGQVYVALSRCTSLDGLVLQSRIRNGTLYVDKRIAAFSSSLMDSSELGNLLAEEKRNYQKLVILSLFKFESAVEEYKLLENYFLQHHSSFNSNAAEWFDTIRPLITRISDTGEKFQFQLGNLFDASTLEENDFLIQRLTAGAQYFTDQISEVIGFLEKPNIVTDSRIHAKECNDLARNLFAFLTMKKYMLQGFGGKFDMELYHKRKNNFRVPTFTFNIYAGNKAKSITENNELYQLLKSLRDDICRERDLPVYLVLTSKSLEEMATFLPQTLEELEEISGFGKAKLKAYGKAFLDIIVDYSRERELTSRISSKSPKRKRKEKDSDGKPKVNTKQQSYELYISGKTIPEIAAERGLSVSTIEGHLSWYVGLGKLEIDRFVNEKKITLITHTIKELKAESLNPVKETLGEQVTYSEVRYVMAWLEYQNKVAMSQAS